MSTMVYEGIRVLDFTEMQHGPVAAQALGDWGAEVIKIERPAGAGMRKIPTLSRNKKSIALDLKKPEGKQIVYDLVKTADVVISNFRPGVMERLGLGYDDLDKINPRIIVAYGSGYGQTGPDRDELGQDMMAQARAALVRGDPPRGAPCAFVDQFGGMMLAMGVMLALAAREKTGRGQVVDSCLLNVAVFADTVAATNLLNREADAPKKDPRRKNPLYMAYKSADDRWVYIIGTFRDKALQRAFRALEIPQEVQDHFPEGRMKTTEDTLKAYDILAEAVSKLPADEVVKRVKAQDMMSVKAAKPEEVYEDPQVLHNRMIEEIELPSGKTVKTIGFPVKLSDTPARVRIPPPELGQDNEAILKDILGMEDDRIGELYDKGVLHRPEAE